jgi:predicted O-methyltransferase YrrM
VESKIDLRLAPALQTLDALLAEPGGRDGYDFAFVDADKGNYIAYYEKLLELVRPGGVIAIDNTLGLSGQYITELTTPGAQAIRAFNTHVHHDARVELSMLPIGEGLTLLRVL